MWLTWREATERALYGDDGFYRRGEQPSHHFRTSVHASAALASAAVKLLCDIDAVLGHPARLDVIDVGAGGGEFAMQLGRIAPAQLRARLRITAVELGPRPPGLPIENIWTASYPEQITGLVIANEWLDNIPLDVVEQTADGPRLLLVNTETGTERIGPTPTDEDQAWLARWWPLDNIGDRAEVGRPRDEAWTDVVERLHRGVAVAVDYAHQRQTRPQYGTLAGYRGGRAVRPIPNGLCDITSHVALDACAAAGAATVRRGTGSGDETVLTTQRDALRQLGVRGGRPPVLLGETDPVRYLRELQRAGEEGELLDPNGLGAFGWLVQSVNLAAPGPIRASMTS